MCISNPTTPVSYCRMKALRDPSRQSAGGGALPEYDCGNVKCRFSNLNPANAALAPDDGYESEEYVCPPMSASGGARST